MSQPLPYVHCPNLVAKVRAARLLDAHGFTWCGYTLAQTLEAMPTWGGRDYPCLYMSEESCYRFSPQLYTHNWGTLYVRANSLDQLIAYMRRFHPKDAA